MPREKALSAKARIATDGHTLNKFVVVRGPDALRCDCIHGPENGRVVQHLGVTNSQDACNELASKFITLEWPRRLAGAGDEE
jgi:hypothetical protein